MLSCFLLYSVYVVLLGTKLDKSIEINAAYIGSDQKYTSEEKLALDKFREMVSSFSYLDYQSENGYLINWLKHKNMDLQAAAKAFKASMQWRKENDIDNILQDKELIKMKKSYPSTFGKAVDKKGHPASEMSYSSWNFRRAVLAGKRDQVIRLMISAYEQMTTIAREMGTYKYVSLTDMQGYNKRDHGCLLCIPILVNATMTFENNYPNSMSKIIAINTPRLYGSVFDLLRTFMGQETKQALNFFGSNKNEWQPFLLNLFSKEQLPIHFGGTRTS